MSKDFEHRVIPTNVNGKLPKKEPTNEQRGIGGELSAKVVVRTGARAGYPVRPVDAIRHPGSFPPVVEITSARTEIRNHPNEIIASTMYMISKNLELLDVASSLEVERLSKEPQTPNVIRQINAAEEAFSDSGTFLLPDYPDRSQNINDLTSEAKFVKAVVDAILLINMHPTTIRHFIMEGIKKLFTEEGNSEQRFKNNPTLYAEKITEYLMGELVRLGYINVSDESI